MENKTYTQGVLDVIRFLDGQVHQLERELNLLPPGVETRQIRAQTRVCLTFLREQVRLTREKFA